MAEKNLPLIAVPEAALANSGPNGGRIVNEMVGTMLGLTKNAQITDSRGKWSIGKQSFFEPDYMQLMLWAAALEMDPEELVERLEKPVELLVNQIGAFGYTATGRIKLGHHSTFVNGRLINICWNLEEFPVVAFEWVAGLMIEELEVVWPQKTPGAAGNRIHVSQCILPELELRDLTQLRELRCQRLGLRQLKLSGVPALSWLNCCENQLAELNLSDLPLLEKVFAGNNQIAALDMSVLPKLTELSVSGNKLVTLDLSCVPKLEGFWVSDNQLSVLNLSCVPFLTTLVADNNQLRSLNLSVVPLLKALWVEKNDLAELDIRPLLHLETLGYDKDRTRLIQRPDQHF